MSTLQKIGQKGKIKKFTAAAILLVSLFCITITANAAISYNNLNSETFSYDSILEYGPLADSFSTQSGFILTDVTLKLFASNPADGGFISVDLFSSNSNSPGTLLTNIGTLSDSQLSSSWTYSQLTLASPYTLDPNTRYWIWVFGSNSSAQWAYSYDMSAIGVNGEYYYIDGVYVNSTEYAPYQMQVSGTVAPVPAAVWLLGSGLIGLIGIRRFRK